MPARQRCFFILIVMMGMIAQASYAGGPVVVEPAQSVVVLGEEAIFVGGTNDLTAWASEGSPRKYRLTVFDRAGKKAVGYVGAVGCKEALGSELVFDGEMEMFTKKGRLSSLWWTKDRCETAKEMESLRPGTEGKAAVKVTVVNGKNPWGPNAGHIWETISIKNDRLYKLSGWLKNGPEADSVYLLVQDTATGKQIENPHQQFRKFAR